MNTINGLYGQPGLQTRQFVQGFNYVRNTTSATTRLILGLGSARANNNDSGIEVDTSIGFLSVNTTVTGPGGCFPIPMSQFTAPAVIQALPIFVIWNSSGTTNGSLNPNLAPQLIVATNGVGFLPPGFDSYAFVNVLFITNTKTIYICSQTGYYESKTFTFLNAPQFLTNGSATTDTLINLANFNPLALGYNNGLNGFTSFSPVVTMNVVASFNSAGAGDTLFLSPSNQFTDGPIYPVEIKNTAAGTSISNFGIAGGQGNNSLFYHVTAGGDIANLYMSSMTIDMMQIPAQS